MGRSEGLVLSRTVDFMKEKMAERDELRERVRQKREREQQQHHQQQQQNQAGGRNDMAASADGVPHSNNGIDLTGTAVAGAEAVDVAAAMRG